MFFAPARTEKETGKKRKLFVPPSSNRRDSKVQSSEVKKTNGWIIWTKLIFGHTECIEWNVKFIIINSLDCQNYLIFIKIRVKHSSVHFECIYFSYPSILSLSLGNTWISEWFISEDPNALWDIYFILLLFVSGSLASSLEFCFYGQLCTSVWATEGLSHTTNSRWRGTKLPKTSVFDEPGMISPIFFFPTASPIRRGSDGTFQ